MQDDRSPSSRATLQYGKQFIEEQTRLLFDTLPMTYLGHVVLGALAIWVAWDNSTSWSLTLWVMLMAAMIFGRVVLSRYYRQQASRPDADATKWQFYFRVGVVASGVVWALASIMLFPSDSLSHQILFAFTLVGVSTGAATSLSVDLVSILIFVNMALIPLLVRFILQGEQIAITVAFMVTGFFIFMAVNAVRGARYFKENLILRIEAEIRDAALQSAKLESERANEAKSRFISSMSHELRTPMNAVIGFTQLMQMDNTLSQTQREHLKTIIQAGDHLLSLINEVLDLSRIEAGRVTLAIEDVDVKDVLDESLTMITPLAAQSNIELHPPETYQDGLKVKADRTRLKQVLINLASNAIKYNRQQGQVRIDVQAADNNRIRLSVTDTGPGIPAERQPELFTMFNRLGHEASQTEGTGIGLTVAKRLIELMDGTIGLQSAPNQGSTFWIELPAA